MKKCDNLYLLMCLCFLISCDTRDTSRIERTHHIGENAFKKSSDELDHIFMMMAYAVVYKDWQNLKDIDNSRGYNIGSVIVNADREVISWGRNEKFLRRDGTQHGEVRAIQSYLDQSDAIFLEGCTIYTTLEPCAMCAGMIVMSRIERVVFGQSDPDYGKALERLHYDNFEQSTGLNSYPRDVEIIKAKDGVTGLIDDEYLNFGKKGTTRFLSTEVAKYIMKTGYDSFLNYHVQFEKNQQILDNARMFFQQIP